MLVLNNEEVAQALSMESCLQVLDDAARAMASDDAVARPATSVVMPKQQLSEWPGAYKLESREGIARTKKMAACRLMSDNFGYRKLSDGSVRKFKIPAAPGERYVGLILLFDTDTSRLVAMFPDAEIQRRRVAATGALSTQYIARQDAHRMALVGSSWQAEMALLAHSLARNISEVRVFSPNREHRESFCARMRPRVSCSIQPVETLAEAMKGSDLVVGATSGPGATVLGEFLEPGMHVTLVRYFELDRRGWERCSVIIDGERPQNDDPMFWGKQVYDFRWVMGGRDKAQGTDFDVTGGDFHTTRARHAPLPDIVAGHQPGRQSDDEITCFYISVPSGAQLAFLGAHLVEEARRHGYGRELPDEWFSETEPD